MYGKYEALRDEKKLSDYKVSQETGIATSTLTDWKKGRYKPKVDKLQVLAKFFSVPIEYFLEE